MSIRYGLAKGPADLVRGEVPRLMEDEEQLVSATNLLALHEVLVKRAVKIVRCLAYELLVDYELLALWTNVDLDHLRAEIA